MAARDLRKLTCIRRSPQPACAQFSGIETTITTSTGAETFIEFALDLKITDRKPRGKSIPIDRITFRTFSFRKQGYSVQNISARGWRHLT
jgi:hypothetical protein